MTKTEKRNRCWCGTRSSLFEVSRLFGDWREQDPSGGRCIAGWEVGQRSVPLQLGLCSFLIFPTGPWCQNAQVKMCNWSLSGNSFFLNYRQKTQWQRPCVAQSSPEWVGPGTLVERMTGAAQSQARWNVVVGMRSQIVTTRGMKGWVLIKENRFHWLQDSLNHCACHSHSGLLMIKKENHWKDYTLLHQTTNLWKCTYHCQFSEMMGHCLSCTCLHHVTYSSSY